MMHRGWVTTARFLRYCASHHALHLQPLGSTPLIQYSAKPFCSSSDEASGDRVRTASNAGRGEQRQPSGADLENVFEQSPVDQDKAAKAWLSAKKVYTDASTLFRCLSECSLRPRTVVRMLQVIHNQRPAYFEPLSNNELLRACRLTAFRTHFAREAAAYHVLKKLFFTLLERDLAPESAEEFLSTLIHLGDFAASINASQIVREKFPFGLYRKVLERNKAFLIEQIATLDAPTLVRVLGCCWELGFIDHGVCSVGFPLLNQLNFNDLDSQTTEQLIALSLHPDLKGAPIPGNIRSRQLTAELALHRAGALAEPLYKHGSLQPVHEKVILRSLSALRRASASAPSITLTALVKIYTLLVGSNPSHRSERLDGLQICLNTLSRRLDDVLEDLPESEDELYYAIAAGTPKTKEFYQPPLTAVPPPSNRDTSELLNEILLAFVATSRVDILDPSHAATLYNVLRTFPVGPPKVRGPVCLDSLAVASTFYALTRSGFVAPAALADVGARLCDNLGSFTHHSLALFSWSLVATGLHKGLPIPVVTLLDGRKWKPATWKHLPPPVRHLVWEVYATLSSAKDIDPAVALPMLPTPPRYIAQASGAIGAPPIFFSDATRRSNAFARIQRVLEDMGVPFSVNSVLNGYLCAFTSPLEDIPCSPVAPGRRGRQGDLLPAMVEEAPTRPWVLELVDTSRMPLWHVSRYAGTPTRRSRVMNTAEIVATQCSGGLGLRAVHFDGAAYGSVGRVLPQEDSTPTSDSIDPRSNEPLLSCLIPASLAPHLDPCLRLRVENFLRWGFDVMLYDCARVADRPTLSSEDLTAFLDVSCQQDLEKVFKV